MRVLLAALSFGLTFAAQPFPVPGLPPLPLRPLPGLPPLPPPGPLGVRGLSRFPVARGPLFPAGAFLPHHPGSGKPILRPFVPLTCPPIPLRPTDNEHCKWTGLHDVRGCLIRYKCEPLEPPPKPCPPSPRRPDLGSSCNWIPIQDKRGCIIDYECEPLTPPPCPAPPEKPPASPVCRWVAIKDKRNCITSYSCEPNFFLNRVIRPRLLLPRVAILPRRLPIGHGFTGPVSNPLAALARFRRVLSGPPGDSHPLCCFWASIGQCPVNPAYMLNDCAHACKSTVCVAKGGFLG